MGFSLKAESLRTPVKSGGAEGDRTPDLMTASHALSQLSYDPTSSQKYNICLITIQTTLFEEASWQKEGKRVLVFLSDLISSIVSTVIE